MKNKIRTALFTSVYLALYATLWATFAYGVNIYMDRYQDVMTGLYILTNSLVGFLVLCMWILNYAVEKDSKIQASMKEFALNAKYKDFMNMKDRHNRWYNLIYRYAAFYPAIFCAGILLGYYNLAFAMALDVVLYATLRNQIASLKEKVTK